MPIKPRKIKMMEEIAQQQSLSDIVEEAKLENDIGHEAESIRELLPTLKQYHEDLVEGQNNIINERLGIESFMHWHGKELADLEKRYEELLDKIDHVQESVEKKLTVTVVVSESDKKAIQQDYNDQIRKMKELHEKQMSELRGQFDHECTWMYERNNELRGQLHERLKSEDIYCVSGIPLWVNRFFYWIGVVVVVGFVVVQIYKATR